MTARMIPRRLAPALTAALAEAPAVALLGPRQVGKTTLSAVRMTRRWSGGPRQVGKTTLSAVRMTRRWSGRAGQ